MANDADATLATQLGNVPIDSPTAVLLAASAPASATRVIALLLQQAEHETSSDPRQALHLAQRALDVSAHGDSDDPALRAACVRALGHAYFELGHYTHCLDLYDQAARLYRKAHRPTEAARTHLSTIHALMYLGRTADALALGRGLRRIFARHGETLNLAKLEANLAVIHARFHRSRRALALADSAAERFAALGEELLLAQLNVNRANMLTNSGAFRRALDAYTAARAAFAAHDMRSWAATIDFNIGFLYAAQGHYNRALTALGAAIQVFTDLDSPKDLALAQLDLADVYLTLNLDAEAATLAAQAADTFAAADMRHDVARALLIQARATADDPDAPGTALDLLERAGATFSAEGFAVGAAIVGLHQAALLKDSDPVHALQLAMAAEPVLARQGLVAQHGQSLLLKAIAHEKLGERRPAYAAFKRAQRLGTRYGLPWVLAEAHHGVGRLHERRNLAAAHQSYEAAIDAIEGMRAELQPDDVRISFVRGRLGPYEDLLRLLLRTDDAHYREAAFTLVERARSRALLDMLAGNLDVATEGGVATTDPTRADLDARIDQLREELNWQLSIIHDWSDDARQRHARLARHEALQSAQSVEDELHELIRWRRVLDPADRTPHTARVFDVATVQAHLAPNQALIEYTVVDDEVLAFVVGRDSVTLVRRLCSAAEAGQLIDRLHAGLQRFSYGETWIARYGAEMQQTTERHLARLGDALIAPLTADLARYDRLVIAPHGPLHYVPFHALHGPTGDLLDTHETVVVPSASVWVLCQRQAASLARTPSAVVLGVEDSQTPWMVREAQSVGRLFAGARVCTGADASMATLSREAATCDLLHLACHGLFRSDDPLFSALQLADGWLTVYDIYNLRLRAWLVTLSGCQTGHQSVGPGDDLVGLTRGFISAGARQLVVSLWMVNDASTSLFMEHFYRALCQDQSTAAALRAAQCTLRDRFHHPYYWAPFVVIGAS